MQITFEGHHVGSYTLLDEIGRGGTARVYRASHPDTSQIFAIKLVNALTSSDTRYEERFQREVDVIRRLNHPGILPVIESGRTEDGTLYMVMPLIEGGTLKTYFFRRPVLAPAQAQMILSQIGPALDYAHSKGIIHRDVKPHNIMLMGDGKVCLADFGIAHLLSLDTTMGSLTTTGAAIGTFAYMSPEQVSGHGLDGRSDLYSFGIVMYQALVGRMPFSGDTTATIISQQLHARPIPPRKVNPAFPAEVEAVLDRAMAKEANERFQTGAEFVQAFDECLRALPEEMRNHPLVTTDQVEAAAGLANDALLTTSTVILPATPRQRITRWGLAILALLLVVCGVSTFVINPLQTQLQNAQGTANALASRTPMIIVVTDATGKTIYIQVTATGEVPQDQTATSTPRLPTALPTATATVPSSTPPPTESPAAGGSGASGGTVGGAVAGATTGGTTAGATTGGATAGTTTGGTTTGTTAGTTTGGTTTTGTGTGTAGTGTGGTTAGNTGGTTAGNTGGTTAGNTGGTTAGNTGGAATGTGGGAAGGNPNTPRP